MSEKKISVPVDALRRIADLAWRSFEKDECKAIYGICRDELRVYAGDRRQTTYTAVELESHGFRR